jgi:hypothetical protein
MGLLYEWGSAQARRQAVVLGSSLAADVELEQMQFSRFGG